MALGSFNNQGNDNKVFEPRYYSRAKLRNYVTHMGIDISYSGGLMRLEITKGTGDSRQDPVISGYLTGNKARLLYDQMQVFNSKFMEGDKKLTPSVAFGVQAGMGEISTVLAFHVNKDGNRAFTIAKIDKNGTITDRQTYDFAIDDAYSIQWSNFDQMKYDKVMDNDIDFNNLGLALKNFADFFDGAAAAIGYDIGRYEANRNNTVIRQIASKMGIEINQQRNNYSNSGGGSGFFNNSTSGPATSTHKTADEIDSFISGD